MASDMNIHGYSNTKRLQYNRNKKTSLEQESDQTKLVKRGQCNLSNKIGEMWHLKVVIQEVKDSWKDISKHT